jgi:hypothetical protein
VQQDDVGLRSNLRKCPHPAQHLVTTGVGIVPVPDEEGEDPDVARTEEACDLGGVLHPLQVRLEVLIDEDLADRRADAGHGQPMLGEDLAGPLQLFGVEVQDVGPPRAAEHDVAQAEALGHRALLGEVV